ncbi:MAG: hypothetical protein R3D68_20145 [Hyphomicrobiaceae bacterium]
MDLIRARQFSSYQYGDPRGYLVELRKAEVALGSSVMPERVRRLRTNGLKSEREMRDAALFCVGIGERCGLQIRFAPVEDEDFDFVSTWSAGESRHFCCVQLKELVPDDLNRKASIEDVLKTLSKYQNATDLTIAIRLNRDISFDPASLKLPEQLKLGGLWVFGSVSEDQSRWAVWGDFASAVPEPFGTVFEYPS